MLITLAEAARRLGVCEPTARKILRDLPSVRVGKRTRWNADTVSEFAKGIVKTSTTASDA